MKRVLVILIVLVLLEGYRAERVKWQTVLSSSSPPSNLHGTMGAKTRLILTKTSDKEADKQLLEHHGCESFKLMRNEIVADCPEHVVQVLTVDSANTTAYRDGVVKLHGLHSALFSRARFAWNQGVKGEGVLVAIIDTGVDATHPELKNSLQDVVSVIDDSGGDDKIHGTMVAGVIAGAGSETVDVTAKPFKVVGHKMNDVWDEEDYTTAKGVAPSARILAIKACNGEECRISDVMLGVDYAVEHKAKVLSMSLGTGNFDGVNCDDDPMAEKANWAVDNGVLVVASSGNDGGPLSSPACASKVVSVGAIYYKDGPGRDYEICEDDHARAGEEACFSNKGPSLDILAPGVDVVTTAPCDVACYVFFSGTSASAPHVAAAAALLLQENPNLSVDQLKAALLISARQNRVNQNDQVRRLDVQESYAYINGTCASNIDCAPFNTSDVGGRCFSYACDGGKCLKSTLTSGSRCLQNEGSTSCFCCSDLCKRGSLSTDATSSCGSDLANTFLCGSSFDSATVLHHDMMVMCVMTVITLLMMI